MSPVIDWLNKQFQGKGIVAHVHENLARQDGDWLYLPVYVQMNDAYDKATLLQEIEDKWGTERVTNQQFLLLIPTAN